MWKTVLGVATMLGLAAPASAQTALAEAVEIPLRIVDGRLVVTAHAPDGSTHDFVLGLGMMLLTESGATRVGDAISSLTLGGLPIDSEMAQTVPDAFVGSSGAVGVLGGLTLNGYDLLIDAPAGRLVVKPVERFVAWDDVELSSPVPVQIFHDVLLRTDVDLGGKVVGGLIDLANPGLQVNDPLAFAVSDGVVQQFRMGYTSWSSLPVEVTDNQTLRGWDRTNQGFVVIGAAVAYDCVIAISWAHAELRTCVR